MQRMIVSAILLVLLTVAADARTHRRHHHHVHYAPVHSFRADVQHYQSAAGPVTLAAAIANRMLGYIADIVQLDSGMVGKVHCYAPTGHIRNSLHHSANACDFAQRGWNATRPVMYKVQHIAIKWGLRDGCTFRSRKDCGHIDAGLTRYASRAGQRS